MACVTGDETGVVKLWDITRSSGATVKTSYGTQSRARGVASLCWVDRDTTDVLISMHDGTVSHFSTEDQMMISCVKRDLVAASSTSMSVIDGKLIMVEKSGRVAVTSWEDTDEEDGAPTRFLDGNGPAEAVHIQRRYGLAAIGGKENDLQIWDLRGERTEPLFKAQNVRDHVLDVPFPVYIAGAAIVDPHIFCVATAYHQVRFYDRRVAERPVQEYAISREIQRRPTTLMQWNCNKFLIGEASGDIHMYDTRRGFTSRAKLRGGVGSVRQMVKHPGGHQLLVSVGLDRKARVYHVPTGRLLSEMYLKQKGTSVLFGQGQPFVDNVESYTNITNVRKAPGKHALLGDKVWDEMDPVVDEFEGPEGEVGVVSQQAKKADKAVKADKAEKKPQEKKPQVKKPLVKKAEKRPR